MLLTSSVQVVNVLPIDDQLFTIDFNALFEPVIDSVIFQKVGNVLNRSNVVHCDQFYFRCIKENLQRTSSNPSHAVNYHLCRVSSSLHDLSVSVCSLFDWILNVWTCVHS